MATHRLLQADSAIGRSLTETATIPVATPQEASQKAVALQRLVAAAAECMKAIADLTGVQVKKRPPGRQQLLLAESNVVDVEAQPIEPAS